MTRPLGKKLALIILDGWGINPRKEGNTLAMARVPHFDSLFARYPNTRLHTSGLKVGLPDGQMGNSEVGHMNIGSGRVIYQDFTRINRAIETGELASTAVLTRMLDGVRERGAALHLYGLVSDGGVHSHIEHLFAILDIARDRGVQDVRIHAVTDGRDTSPTSGIEYLRQLDEFTKTRKSGRIVTVSGRYYAMDRDKRWERVERAYKAIVLGEGRRTADISKTVTDGYLAGETDEFIVPTVVAGVDGTVRDGDMFFCFNFRADRVRQMTRALTQPDFAEFPVRKFPKLAYLCLTRYDDSFDLPVLFGPSRPDQVMGQLVAKMGRQQLRIAETEKYAHVTYFFNGGEEACFEGEKRILIPSPKVATYDLKPEMSAPELTDTLIEEVRANDYDLIVTNYANCDMVGHTGKIPAAIHAVEALDKLLAKLFPALQEKGFTIFLTADHGNIEQMIDYETGQPFTEHTLFPVPLLVTDEKLELREEPGKLADIAPTLLAYAGCDIPGKMEGDVLIR